MLILYCVITFCDVSSGEKIVLNLTMDDEILVPRTSRNVFGEIVGSTLPDEIVAVSGHIDAWDVGQGAMDDAGKMTWNYFFFLVA
jgi:Zn-dependent M28 family amino/carboxypeptidase